MAQPETKAMLRPVNPRRAAWGSEIQTQINAIYRDTPRSVVVDRGQALQRAAGVMLGGDGALMARRYLIRGLLGDGFTEAEVVQALSLVPDELARAKGPLPIHQANAKKLAELLARELPHVSDDAGYTTSSDRRDKRQGDLVRGSRGWRTPPDSLPQTTTPKHA